MAVKQIANIVVPAATMQASTANVLNYIGIDGSMASSGQTNPQAITTFPASQFIFNGSYYDELIFSVASAAQAGSTTPVIDVYRILPPGTPLSGPTGISVITGASPCRLTLSAAAASFGESVVEKGAGAVTASVKDNVGYGFFVITFFSSTAVTTGGILQVNIQGLTHGRLAGENSF